MLAGPLHADSSPGRATEAAKAAAGKLLERVKCPAFSPLDLHNGFPSTVKVMALWPHMGCCENMQHHCKPHVAGAAWPSGNTWKGLAGNVRGTCASAHDITLNARVHCMTPPSMLLIMLLGPYEHIRNTHILCGSQRLLDASIPLPQELMQAQKGLPKQAQRTPLLSRPRDDAAPEQENSGAGQAGRGPAKAAKTRHRMAMQDSGEPVSASLQRLCSVIALPADMAQPV